MVSAKIFPLLALAASAQAQVSTKLSSKGCADSSGLEKCQSTANDKTSACIAQARKDNSQEEILACSCADYVSNYNCFASHCWNRVWECEYQDYMVGYFKNCFSAKTPVPYFPAPDNVADACSCNLGKVFDAIESAIQENTACSNAASSGTDAGSNLQKMQGCSCCAIGGSIGALAEICPETNPKLIGLNEINQVEQNLNVDYPNCGPYLEQFNCVSDLGFSLNGVSKYFGPSDPLTTGTNTLSNGGGTVTAPASGAVFTYTNGGDSQVYTITAANFNSRGSSGGSGSGSGSGSDSSSESDSSQSASASATGSSSNDNHKGAAGQLNSNRSYLIVAAWLIVALTCLSL